MRENLGRLACQVVSLARLVCVLGQGAIYPQHLGCLSQTKIALASRLVFSAASGALSVTPSFRSASGLARKPSLPAAFEIAEQLCLKLERHKADLGVGESASLVAEELCFDQI